MKPSPPGRIPTLQISVVTEMIYMYVQYTVCVLVCACVCVHCTIQSRGTTYLGQGARVDDELADVGVSYSHVAEIVDAAYQPNAANCLTM